MFSEPRIRPLNHCFEFCFGFFPVAQEAFQALREFVRLPVIGDGKLYFVNLAVNQPDIVLGEVDLPCVNFAFPVLFVAMGV